MRFGPHCMPQRLIVRPGKVFWNRMMLTLQGESHIIRPIRISRESVAMTAGRWGAGFLCFSRFVGEFEAAAAGPGPRQPGYVPSDLMWPARPCGDDLGAPGQPWRITHLRAPGRADVGLVLLGALVLIPNLDGHRRLRRKGPPRRADRSRARLAGLGPRPRDASLNRAAARSITQGIPSTATGHVQAHRRRRRSASLTRAATIRARTGGEGLRWRQRLILGRALHDYRRARHHPPGGRRC